MKIYHDSKISEMAEIPVGDVMRSYIIRTAKLYPPRRGNFLHIKGDGFEYALIGNNIYGTFMADAQVSEPDELVGRTIYAIVRPNTTIRKIQGLALEDLD